MVVVNPSDKDLVITIVITENVIIKILIERPRLDLFKPRHWSRFKSNIPYRATKQRIIDAETRINEITSVCNTQKQQANIHDIKPAVQKK